MKRISLFLLLTLFIGVTVSQAQVARQMGARRLVLDNNDNVAANNLILINQNGNLGIDNTGIITGTYPAAATLLSLKLGAKTTGLNIAGGGTSITADGSISTTGTNNIFGNSTTTNNILVVNGINDATILSTAANTVWDSRINGDQLVTGVQKIGGSIWLDGTSATHSIVTDAPTNVGTKNANSLSLITNNLQRLTIDATGNVTINGNLTVNGTLSTVPEVVNFLGAYSAATTYGANDLVTSTTPGVYFYSLSAGNLNHTPETSPTFWGATKIEQLKTIHKTLTLSSPGFTSLMSSTLTGLNTASGRIQYMVRADDGGSQIATEEGVMQYLATANSITCTVQTDDKLHLGTVNSGCTPGFFNPGSQPGVSIFDNVTFSSPAPIINHDVYFRIVPAQGQMSGGAVSPVPFRLEP
ncbi:MAG: hypothetical protein Q8916_13180 [Bacteroidota bacterium]|nr:hypothetical protein [Bacteroidota bacterium]MDP4231345.1 hypothetical protein [Bacteroidota bacterium]MDP4236536.1 hypothetical protein [Bacteroidota bacterium]